MKGKAETMKALTKALGRTREETSKLSYHLSRLEAYGLVKTERNSRELPISLTETGLALTSEKTLRQN
jgi:DNA-binding MarR family transcriptional regulator